MVDFVPTEIRFFWSRGTGPISRQISRITAPGLRWLTGRTKDVPSHMGIVLIQSQRNVYERITGIKTDCIYGEPSWIHAAYGEAHYGTNWRYPLPINLLYAWRDQKEGRKVWLSEPLPVPVEVLPMIHTRAERAVRIWRYSTGQIWRMWLWRRLHIPIPTTPDEVVCSEAAVRLVCPWWDLPLRMGLRGPDYVTPANSMAFVGGMLVTSDQQQCRD